MNYQNQDYRWTESSWDQTTGNWGGHVWNEYAGMNQNAQQWHVSSQWHSTEQQQLYNNSHYYAPNWNNHANANGGLMHGGATHMQWNRNDWQTSDASIVGSEDELELTYLAQIRSLIGQGDLQAAKRVYNQMRELWRKAEPHFRNRGISFTKFNSRYQEAFRLLRESSESERPAVHTPIIGRRYLRLGANGSDLCDIQPRVSSEFRLMTFNILSEALNDMFGYQFVTLPAGAGDFLRWEFRKPQIVDEIVRWGPSLLCLQEVDLDLASGLLDDLESKANLLRMDLAQRNERSKDGLCFLHDPRLFRVVEPMKTAYFEGLNAIMTAVFEIVDVAHPFYGRRLSLLSTHVAGKEPACTEEVMRCLLSHAESLRHNDTDGIILAGDLNGCSPTSRLLAESFGYRSAYAAGGDNAMAAGGPIVTAHNDEYHWSGELDMILYRGVSPTGLAQIPQEERLVPYRSKEHPERSLPHPGWPSDHISLVADFVFVA
eukprot:TRINITY_DN27341_c0_g1_i1.p1 TRINITY_DN27341_c0_g1~~TRINITY_DN27341_c0_g1_i1.p1  ORF type:complete len:523 (-),score=35.62 TRINITY_DN27341_c0_g1_i1:88-1548(-)